MKEYHKIQTVYKRDPETKYKTLLDGDFSIPEFEYLANNEWVFTEKVNGTNIRVGWDAGMVTFEGRTNNAQIPAFLITELQHLFPANKMAKIFPDGNGCLYGEGYGAKIQKGGGNYRSTASFVLFDVMVGDWWLKRDDVSDVAIKSEIDIVPVIGTGTLEDMVRFTKQGFKSQWGNFEAEGIVARPAVEMFTRSGHRIITKIKCKDFSIHKYEPK